MDCTTYKSNGLEVCRPGTVCWMWGNGFKSQWTHWPLFAAAASTRGGDGKSNRTEVLLLLTHHGESQSSCIHSVTWSYSVPLTGLMMYSWTEMKWIDVKCTAESLLCQQSKEADRHLILLVTMGIFFSRMFQVFNLLTSTRGSKSAFICF